MTSLLQNIQKSSKASKYIQRFLHIVVLIISLFLVVSISIDTFNNVAFYKAPHFLRMQFWICIIFLADFFLEWILSENKWKYLASHFLFFLVAIPYLP
ncbi:MAG: two pore domain potassium channel family protein, partial [Muribaculaceae bacterium]|nr:two pore domain potassium channel family protein [Muribaculaceae bacterium]